jgi:hypothetical protein
MGELLTMIDHGSVAAEAPEPRVSTEFINI